MKAFYPYRSSHHVNSTAGNEGQKIKSKYINDLIITTHKIP